MKSSNIIPQEMKEYYTNDKIGIFDNLCFKWRVCLIDIPRLRPNLNFCLAGREQQSQWE